MYKHSPVVAFELGAFCASVSRVPSPGPAKLSSDFLVTSYLDSRLVLIDSVQRVGCSWRCRDPISSAKLCFTTLVGMSLPFVPVCLAFRPT